MSVTPLVFYGKLRKLSNSSYGFTVPGKLVATHQLINDDSLKITIQKSDLEPVVVPEEASSPIPVLVGEKKESEAVIE